MGALFDANFETTLPAIEANNLDLNKPDEKVQDNERKLSTLGMGALSLVMTPQMINMIDLECNRDTNWPSGKLPIV